jgi:hypothetical protein
MGGRGCANAMQIQLSEYSRLRAPIHFHSFSYNRFARCLCAY